MTTPTTVIVVDEKPDLVAPGTPTQVANPSRASWRTFVQSAIAFLVTLNLSAVAVQTIVEGNPDLLKVFPVEITGPLLAALNIIVVLGALVSKVLALVMADPRVNTWITKYLPSLAPIKRA